jgi:hypothetical protein
MMYYQRRPYHWLIPIGIIAAVIVGVSLCSNCTSLPKGHVMAPPVWCTGVHEAILCVLWTGGKCYAYACPGSGSECGLIDRSDKPLICEPEWADQEDRL